jgi:tetratricopeptide (TPR) repeat protein
VHAAIVAALLSPGAWASAEVPTASPSPSDMSDAARFEAEAFAAVEAKRWCEAMRLFEAAYALGPAVELQFNAAQAAELAGDLESAMALLKSTIPALSGKQKTETQRRLAALQDKVARSASAACPSLEALRPREPAPPPAEPPPTAPTTTAPIGPATTTPTAASSALPAILPGVITAGVGGAAIVGGGALVAVGLDPWFAHADAVARITDAEARRADATALQFEQAEARAAWESSGRTLTVVGATLVTVGVVAVGGGVAWALLAPPPEEVATTAAAGDGPPVATSPLVTPPSR